MPIIIYCGRTDCPGSGRKLTLRDESAGSTIECPACDRPIKVPSAAPSRSGPSVPPVTSKPSKPASALAEDTPPSPPSSPHPRPRKHTSPPPLPVSLLLSPGDEPEPFSDPESVRYPWWRDPVRLGGILTLIFGFWLSVFLIALYRCLTREAPSAFAISLTVVTFFLMLISVRLMSQLFTAKQRAISGHQVTLFFGMARLVAWEQNEGLIFLRDKRVSQVIDDRHAGGGLRIIYPFLGEELKGRVPLSLQMTTYVDERVLTQESVQLKVKVAIWWEVTQLRTYFYRIDHEAHKLRDRPEDALGAGIRTIAGPTARGPLAIAEIWVTALAESCLRSLISGTSTLLIVSKRAKIGLPHSKGDTGLLLEPDAGDPVPATPEVIARQLKDELCKKVQDYGLMIERIEVQEVQLPPGIQKAVDDVWETSTLPAKSAYEAEAQRKRLQVLVEQLGQPAAAMSEIVKGLPTGAFSSPLGSLHALLSSLGAVGSGSAALGPGYSAPPTTTPGSPPPPS
jgi:regulator of protease activity HflC (stomatin/prohibitin superfamily)